MTTEEALGQILRENGVAILDDYSLVRAFLKDLAPKEKAQNFVLVTCLEYGLHKRLETQSLEKLADFVFEERGLDKSLVMNCLKFIRLFIERIKVFTEMKVEDLNHILCIELKKDFLSIDLGLIYCCILNGADVNISLNLEHKSPLHCAAFYNHFDLAKILIEKGANLETQDFFSQTALHYAVVHKYPKVAVLLIEKGANIEAEDNNGWRALHLSVSHHSLDAVIALVEKGAYIDSIFTDKKYGFNITPLCLASQNNGVEVAKFLIEKGARVHKYSQNYYCENYIHRDFSTAYPLLIAAENNCLEVAKLLIEKGAPVEAITDGGNTALRNATRKNSLKVAKLLIEKGASIDAKPTGETILHFAAIFNSLEVAMLFVENGATIDAKTNSGATPLYSAAATNSLQVAKLLIENGAEINTKNNTYSTPLHIAAANNSLDAAKLLIAKGARLHILNNDWKAPFELSATNEMRNILKLNFWDATICKLQKIFKVKL